jgi:hypothetical protein
VTGFVYFLRCGDFVKIGFSADPQRRLRYLQTATPFDFELLGYHAGTKWHEQRLHKVFASLRHRHEWFRADQNLPPPSRAIDIEQATGGDLPRWELRPDLWARPAPAEQEAAQ